MGEMEANRNKNKKYWVGDTFPDETLAKDDRERGVQSLGFQSNYVPWDPETSRTVKFIDTLNGIVLLPHKFLGSDSKFDDSSHSFSAAGDNFGPLGRNLSSATVSQFVETATGGITAAVRAVGVNRNHSLHGGGSGPSFNLGLMRGTQQPSASDLSVDERDDAQSESSEHRFTSELQTNSRGNIAVPKISPFVQNLILKKKKHSRAVVTPSVSTPAAAGDIPPIMRTNSTFETPPLVPPTSPASPETTNKQTNMNPNPLPTLPNPSAPRPSSGVLPIPIPILMDPSLRLGVPVDSQTQSLQTLMSVCTEIPTATSLLLDGLPYLISMTPLSPVEEQAPLPMKVSVGSNKSVPMSVPGTTGKPLFYDPFEAKREKNRIKSSSMYWSNEKIAQIEAIFCNPLAIPVTLHDVHVLVEGVHHSCFYAKTIIIPPDAQEFRSTFLICPRQAGSIKMIGIRFSIFNAIYTSLIDQNTGRGQPSLPRELSLPKKYSRSVTSEPPKIPSPYSTGNDVDDENNAAASLKEKEDKEKSPISEIVIVPESATLNLSTSWGPDLGQSRLSNGSHFMEGETEGESEEKGEIIRNLIPSSLSNGGNPLTTTKSLKLTLYQREFRKEVIRLENLSPHLTVSPPLLPFLSSLSFSFRRLRISKSLSIVASPLLRTRIRKLPMPCCPSPN
jgi:hypothetical protein